MDLTSWLNEWQDTDEVAREARRLIAAHDKQVMFLAPPEQWALLQEAAELCTFAELVWPGEIVELRCTSLSPPQIELRPETDAQASYSLHDLTHATELPALEKALRLFLKNITQPTMLVVKTSQSLSDELRQMIEKNAPPHLAGTWWWQGEEVMFVAK